MAVRSKKTIETPEANRDAAVDVETRDVIAAASVPRAGDVVAAPSIRADGSIDQSDDFTVIGE